MCGVAGLFGYPADEAAASIPRMLEALRHRGPDDEGVWRDDGVCMAQRRLSIIDTSPAGHQPMVSACGRWVLTANGEIYNYGEMREELERDGPIPWRGHSDCEVLLEYVARFGVEAAVRRASGMFAIGIWSRDQKRAWLIRDRMGEKPLYYYADNRTLAFASELTALALASRMGRTLCVSALSEYLRLGYVPAPLSIYEGAHKLEPGSILTWQAGEGPRTSRYWRLEEVIEAGRATRFADTEETVDAFEKTMRCAVKRQMVSDVPIGVFLSGGLDSSLVAAMMQSMAAAPVKTFTLGFDAPEYDEADQARAVAKHLGTDHTELTATAEDALGVVPYLGSMCDEPFADPSQIPTFLVSRLAAAHVKVCLSGDGGDEMFAGYVRYPGVLRLWSARRWLLAPKLAGAALERMPLPIVQRTLGFLGPLARKYASRGDLAAALRKAAGWLGASNRDEMFEATMTIWSNPERLMNGGGGQSMRLAASRPTFDNPLEPMLWRDATSYLPGDILYKVDRSAMAVGLETRAPFLDPEVAAFAWRTPPGMKLRNGVTKWLPRQVLARHLPESLTSHPKLGFTPPIQSWLKGRLRAWADDLLDPALLRRQGYLDPEPVQKAWRGLLDGDGSQTARVWAVIMLQAWLAAR